MNNIYDPFYEVTSNTRELTESEKELQQLAKFMYENFPEYETASEESFSYKAIRILESLKSQLADTKKRLDEELNMNFEKSDNQIAKLLAKNKALEKQLADIKYLSRDEVEKLIEDNTKIYRDVENKEFDYFHRDKFLDAICKLAIPDIDSDKIIEVLDKYIVQYEIDGNGVSDILGTPEEITDEIIKAIKGEE